jgi:hypothetical protein
MRSRRSVPSDSQSFHLSHFVQGCAGIVATGLREPPGPLIGQSPLTLTLGRIWRRRTTGPCSAVRKRSAGGKAVRSRVDGHLQRSAIDWRRPALRPGIRGPDRRAACLEHRTECGSDSNDMATPLELGPDPTSPTVSMTSPSPNSTASHVVPLSAAASDSVGVQALEFFMDGANLGEDITAPYTLDGTRRRRS